MPPAIRLHQKLIFQRDDLQEVAAGLDDTAPVRHEWLDQHIIESIEEAQEFATQWLWTYNNERPNMGIGGITPAQKLKMAA